MTKGPLKARVQAASERFWVTPAVVIALAIACGTAMPAVDGSVTLPDWLAMSGEEDTARAVLTAIVLGFVSEEKDEPVPELSVSVAMALAAASLGLFVIFLHHAVRSLNASAVIRRIAAEGHEAIASPYQRIGRCGPHRRAAPPRYRPRTPAVPA